MHAKILDCGSSWDEAEPRIASLWGFKILMSAAVFVHTSLTDCEAVEASRCQPKIIVLKRIWREKCSSHRCVHVLEYQVQSRTRFGRAANVLCRLASLASVGYELYLRTSFGWLKRSS